MANSTQANSWGPLDPLELQAAIQADPVWFCETVLGLHLWSKQREIIESVRDNEATAVRSSHGCGKTLDAAAVVLWFLAAYAPECLAVTTAPTWRQVRDLLWREIRKLHHRAGGFFDGKLTETRLDFAPDWYAVGLSTNQPENFQGFHSPHLLFVVDEASGVSQSIFEAAEGFLTAAGSRTLLIGNPTQVGGEFYQAFHGQRALYHTIHMSAFDTPAFTGEQVPDDVARVLPSKQWVERMKTKYRVRDAEEQGGTGVRLNPVYEVRVLGQFPSQGELAVVPMFEVENAQAREIDITNPENTWPVVVSCDPARAGDDETVIALRQGKHVRLVDVIQGQDTMQTAGKILNVAREYNPHSLYGRPVIVVDEIGIGAGVIDRLREQHEFRVVAYNASAAPAETNKAKNVRPGGLGGGYPNARSELWFEFAEDWLPELDLDEDEDLLADLCAPEYRIDSQGRRVVEPKEETKKRLGRSPDRADAVMMAFSRPVSVGSTAAPSEQAFGPPTPGGSRWTGPGGGSGRRGWR